MMVAGIVLFFGGLGAVAYTYLGYPLLLRLAVYIGHRGAQPAEDRGTRAGAAWPKISISLPVHNEAHQIRECMESLLALDYPADRRQIVVVSDGSTDGTDLIVETYADRGIELLRTTGRGGKTRAENHAAGFLTGEIVINTDASIRIRPEALKALVRVFDDPTIGVASGRDVSVSDGDADTGESGYVDYEMRLRAWETQAGGIIGASGCFYAIRAHLHRVPLPEFLSRDFASALTAMEHGYRSVSVDDAVCLVPRTQSIRIEFGRKVRTMSRGMETLWHKRRVLHPVKYPVFAWKVMSHKVLRWLTPWFLLLSSAGVALVVIAMGGAPFIVAALSLAAVSGTAIWLRARTRGLSGWFRLVTGLTAINVATMYALIRAVRGHHDPTWVPTRRPAVLSDTSSPQTARAAAEVGSGPL